MTFNFVKMNRKTQETAEIFYNELGMRITAPENYEPSQEDQQLQIKRLITRKQLYCRISIITGQPYVSGYLQQKNETILQGPFYLQVWDQPPVPVEGTQIAEISGEQNGILAFLGDQFSLNGIQGIQYGESSWIIPRDYLLRLPAMTKSEEVVRNEDLVLYMLLAAQSDKDQSQAVRNLYLKRLAACLKDTNVLLPTKIQQPTSQYRNNIYLLEENTRCQAAICKNNSGRDVAMVFTNRKQMYQLMGGEWGFAVQSLSELLEKWDCQLDQSPNYPGMGIYLNKENYAQLMDLL